jgi:peroxisomal membrane protein 2
VFKNLGMGFGPPGLSRFQVSAVSDGGLGGTGGYGGSGDGSSGGRGEGGGAGGSDSGGGNNWSFLSW